MLQPPVSIAPPPRPAAAPRRRSVPADLPIPARSPSKSVTIRSLTSADADAFLQVRLEGLRTCPCAFRHSYAEEATQTPADAAARLDREMVFGAFVDGTLCGLAGLHLDPLAHKRHKGVLFGVYVRAGARREGIGTALVAAVLEAARGRVEQVHAAVVAEALPALRVYDKLGFVRYGTEPRGLKVGTRAFDQALLVRHLDR